MFSPRRPLPVRKQLLHGRVQHLPLRSRDGRDRGGLERGNRLLPPGAARRRAAGRADYTGEGFVPAIIEPRPIADVSAITFLGAELAEKYPSIKTWQVAPPSAVDEEKLITARGRLRPAAQRCARRTPIRYCRATRTPPASATTSTSTIRSSSRASESRRPIRRARQPARRRARARRHHRPLQVLDRRSFVEPLGLLRPVRTDEAQPQGLRGEARLRLGALINDEPRKLDLFLDFAYYDQIDTLPNAQNVETNFTRLVTGEAGLYYTDVKRSLGAVDDEKGIIWELDYIGKPRERRRSRRRFAAGSISGSHCRSRTRPSGCAPRPGGPTATATTPSPISTSADSATTTSTTSRSSATASTIRFRGSRSTRSRALSFVKVLANGTCRRTCSNPRAPRASMLNWLRPSVFVAGLWARPRQLDAAQDLHERRRPGGPALFASCTGTR